MLLTVQNLVEVNWSNRDQGEVEVEGSGYQFSFVSVKGVWKTLME